jgi:hypothetical protein
MPNMTESEVFDKFAQIVAESSRVEAWRIGRDTHLNDLGALHGISHAVFAVRQEITLHSGEELNREWVREYYDREYRLRAEAPVAASPVQ